MRFFLTCPLVLYFLPVIKSALVDETIFVNLINSNQSSWQAGLLISSNVYKTEKSSDYLYTPITYSLASKVKKKRCVLDGVKIPENFDARNRWPECREVIQKVLHQGQCNGCWAFAATGVMSDRLCIQTGGKIKFQFSTEDLLSCCKDCSFGCGLGYPTRAWKYYIEHGIVSGGGIYSSQGCKPYQPFEYFFNKTKTCSRTCYNPSYNVSYFEDKQFGSDYYYVNKTPECIQAEIMEKGPVQTLMFYYEDFPYYKDGVYSYTLGRRIISHSVRIVGWGVEKGIPYWLAANSWGCEWGNSNGFFKIKRGGDECSFEQHVIAGNPKLSSEFTNDIRKDISSDLSSTPESNFSVNVTTWLPELSTRTPETDRNYTTQIINSVRVVNTKTGLQLWVVLCITAVVLLVLLFVIGSIFNQNMRNMFKKYFLFK